MVCPSVMGHSLAALPEANQGSAAGHGITHRDGALGAAPEVLIASKGNFTSHAIVCCILVAGVTRVMKEPW